jgi:hypothetical protein
LTGKAAISKLATERGQKKIRGNEHRAGGCNQGLRIGGGGMEQNDKDERGL